MRRFPCPTALCNRDDLLKAVEEHQVIIIVGETGSGKTTQIPQVSPASSQHLCALVGCCVRVDATSSGKTTQIPQVRCLLLFKGPQCSQGRMLPARVRCCLACA